MKTEVYSWRVSAELKTGLEHEARQRRMSLSAVLDLAAQEWLMRNRASLEGDEEQRSLHQAVSEYVGAIAGTGAGRSENVRHLVRERLRRRHGR
jgi:hypothetical protein